MDESDENAGNHYFTIFSGHRLFYNNRFNLIDRLRGRAREIIQFHIDRCRDILGIIDNKQTEHRAGRNSIPTFSGFIFGRCRETHGTG
jgi:hypothetical protein